QCYGRGCIAAKWLEQDGCRLNADLANLLRHDEPVFLVANNERGAGIKLLQSEQGLLQHSALAMQGQKLLRVECAGLRPQARSGSAGKNDWYHEISCIHN